MRSPEFAIRSSSHPFGFKYAFAVTKPSLVLRKRRFRDQRGKQFLLTSIVAAAGTGESTIDIVVNKAIEAVQFTGDLIKRGIDLGVEGEKVIERTIPAVTGAIEKAAPVAEKVTKSAIDISNTAAPAVKSAVKAASDALSEKGVDVEGVSRGTGVVVKTSIEAAKPVVKSSVDFVTTTPPSTLGYYALAAAVVYFFGPTLLGFVAGTFRGYAGEVSPSAALNSLLDGGNSFLIDIRSSNEKERNGVLDVSQQATGQVVEVEYAFTENRKLRGQLGNPDDVESRITALQIAALRRLSGSSKIYLLDGNGSVSKRVAKKLNQLGKFKCFVVAGGYSGWVRSKLRTKPSSSVFRAEVVSPISVIGSAIGGGTTKRSVGSTGTRKSLPPGK